VPLSNILTEQILPEEHQHRTDKRTSMAHLPPVISSVLEAE
jgi:hypothetical protein